MRRHYISGSTHRRCSEYIHHIQGFPAAMAQSKSERELTTQCIRGSDPEPEPRLYCQLSSIFNPLCTLDRLPFSMLWILQVQHSIKQNNSHLWVEILDETFNGERPLLLMSGGVGGECQTQYGAMSLRHSYLLRRCMLITCTTRNTIQNRPEWRKPPHPNMEHRSPRIYPPCCAMGDYRRRCHKRTMCTRRYLEHGWQGSHIKYSYVASLWELHMLYLSDVRDGKWWKGGWGERTT